MKIFVWLSVQFFSLSFAFAQSFSLNQDYLHFQKHPLENLSTNEIEVLSQYHLVFIAGFLNEGARARYFKDNVTALKKNKIETVSLLFPASRKSVSENIKILHPQILKLYEDGGRKPLIIFGHSKGGIEALSLALTDISLLGNQISRIIVMQSPLNGNSFLDHWIAPSLWFHFSSLEGMDSLRAQQVYESVHQKYLSLPPENQQKFSERVYYISGSRLPSEVSFVFRLPAYLLWHSLKEASDGIISEKNMVLNLFGQNMGHVKADHTELVVSHVPGLNIASEKKTIAFTQALFKNLYRSLIQDKNELISPFAGK